MRKGRKVWREGEVDKTQKGQNRKRKGKLTEGVSCAHTRACSSLSSAVGDIWRFQ